MRSWRLIAVCLLVCSAASAADRDRLHLAFRDYGLYSYADQEIQPLSAGALWYRDKDVSVAGTYQALTLLEYRGVRVEGGAAWAWHRVNKRLELNMLTALSYRVFEHVTVGIWGAPFYGLDGHDSAYGVVVGYAFNVGK